MTSHLLDISEASQRLGVTITTLRRWEALGKLRPVRTFGNHRRYRVEEIEALINPTGEVPSTQKRAFNVEIDSLEQGVKLQPNEEMLNDLVSIVTCFSARLNGARGVRKLKQTIVQTLETLEQERGEPFENDNESDSDRPNK